MCVDVLNINTAEFKFEKEVANRISAISVGLGGLLLFYHLLLFYIIPLELPIILII